MPTDPTPPETCTCEWTRTINAGPALVGWNPSCPVHGQPALSEQTTVEQGGHLPDDDTEPCQTCNGTGVIPNGTDSMACRDCLWTGRVKKLPAGLAEKWKCLCELDNAGGLAKLNDLCPEHGRPHVHLLPTSKAEPGEVETLAREFHECYQKEANRQDDKRHPDNYDNLSENVKEYDRVLARHVLAKRGRQAQQIAELQAKQTGYEVAIRELQAQLAEATRLFNEHTGAVSDFLVEFAAAAGLQLDAKPKDIAEALKAQLATVTAERDELKWRLDGLEK